MNNRELRERVKAYREIYPLSLSKLGQCIGLRETQRCIVSNFMKFENYSLTPNTAKRLDEFLAGRGF